MLPFYAAGAGAADSVDDDIEGPGVKSKLFISR